MSKMSDQLRAVAKAKGDFDLSHGRKAPLYGERSEIESRAADLLDEAEKALAAMLSNPDKMSRVQATAALARIRGEKT